ncbi:cholecystokinin receptor type A-like, partial [Lucilia cuprina]|uniref:cholecystokinin receptor type A-like n=1 Tax=Lucilia cuprina TaxID=7375 RepID=UPI001F050C4C
CDTNSIFITELLTYNTAFTSWPIKSTVLALISNESFAVNETVTTIALNNAHLAFANLTQSNITAHTTIAATYSIPTLLLSPSTTFPTATSSSTISSNVTQQRQSTRSNAFEVPIWLILCYSVILLCAIVGNLLVISTLVQNRRMRTITNVFLLNLAISDILLGVLCMPVTLVGTLLRHFIFGEFFCKLIQFSQAASVAVSSWTLVAISCERYYAICHPLRSRRWQTRSHAYKIIVCIWCGSMLCMLPIAMFSQLMPTSRQGLRKCRENWPSYALPYERSYNLFLVLMLLVLPLMILSVAYILITRTLYVGMRIEKAMIFGGRGQEDMHSPFQRKSNNASRLRKSSFLTSSSMTTTASSRLKLNLSLRCHGRPATTPTYNNITTSTTTNLQSNLDNHQEETNIFCQKQQQQQHNHQLPAQRLYQQHNFQNYHQQHQIVFNEGVQQEQQQQQEQQACCVKLKFL